MLRCLIFTCSSTWTWCSAAWSSLAVLHELDAPLLDLHLQFYMNLMLRCLIFSCVSTWTWCSAAWYALAVLHELDAPLLDLFLRFYVNLVLRYLIFLAAVKTAAAIPPPSDRQTVAASPSDHHGQTVAPSERHRQSPWLARGIQKELARG